MRLVLALCIALIAGPVVAACPVEAGGAPLVVQAPDGTRVPLDATRLDALASQERVQTRGVAGASTPVAQTVRYGGVLLRDVLQATLPAVFDGRAARQLHVVAMATDGYVAVFSWGELFNTDAGEQVLVVRSQEGRASPLALRALADLRPGPRHVRDLCAVVVRAQ